MPLSVSRKLLMVCLLLMVPVSWLATKYQPYQMDGDSVAYMDLADLIHTHQWSGVVNAYWHPLYPAMLTVAQMAVHPTRWSELRAYLWVNELIFLASIAAMLAFVAALVRLRARMLPADDQTGAAPLLDRHALELLGIALVIVGAQRELSTGLVKPDALLETMLLLGFATLLQSLVSGSAVWPLLMGLCFGLAYLTKSFAFAAALLSIVVLMASLRWLRGRAWSSVAASGGLAMLGFAVLAGPYVAALSQQKGRLDFGDSGALNYAWYVSGTEKMHAEPDMPAGAWGSATVILAHPEKRLLAMPGVYSYKAEPHGTYPAWFDPTYFNERVVPRFDLRRLLARDARNAVLTLRYLLNHPEGLMLLALLLVLGARWRATGWRQQGFWLPVMLPGCALWAIYGLVNVEERYVTLAFLLVLLPVFANLRVAPDANRSWLQPAAVAMAALFAFLAIGQTLRLALEDRRERSTEVPLPYAVAQALAAAGLRPGDEVACMGTTACVHDPYWARVAGVRVLTEVYQPDAAHLMRQWQSLPNRSQVLHIVQAEGAKALVASFDPADVTSSAEEPWQRLGETNFYMLPMNIAVTPSPQPAKAWTTNMRVAP